MSDLTQFVQDNLGEPVALTAALAALFSDPKAYRSAKSQPRGTVVDYVEELVLTNRELVDYIATGATPVQRHLHNGRWIATWRNLVPADPAKSYKYDLCISFAGPDRDIARKIASKLVANGMNRRVFYDEFERVTLWGAELFDELHDIYSNQCRFCIILFSHTYRQRAWTRHELRSAQTRTLSERGPYVLPIEVDADAVPEAFRTTAYWPFTPGDEAQIAEAVEERINRFIGDYSLSIEEITESLNHGAVASAMLQGFREGISERRADGDDNGVWITTILALIAVCDTADLIPAARAVVNLVLFSPGLTGDAFDSADNFVVFGEHHIKRSLRSREGYFLSANWQPFIEAGMPQWWQNMDEDHDEPDDRDDEIKDLPAPSD